MIPRFPLVVTGCSSFVAGVLIGFLSAKIEINPSRELPNPVSTSSDQAAQEEATTHLADGSNSAFLPSGKDVAGDSSQILEDILLHIKGKNRKVALEELGRRLASTDLEWALESTKRLSSLADKRSFLLGVVQEWAKIQPQECFDFCVNQDSLALALSLSIAAIEITGATNTELAADLASSVAIQGLRENLIGPAARALAEASGPNAANWATSLPDPLSREIAIREVAGIWASQNPVAAMSWISNLPDSTMRTVATQSAISSWAEQDLEASLDFVSKTKPGPTRDALVTELARNIGFHDPISLMDWLSAQPPNAFYPREMAAVTSYLSELDPREAIVRAQNLPPDYQRIALNAAASTWASNHPYEAMQWIQSVGDQALKAELQKSASLFWAMKDPAQASAYARRLSDTRLQDNALMGIAHALSTSSPQQALGVAVDIKDNQSRIETISGIIMDFASTDPQAVKQLLDSAKISPADRRSLNLNQGQLPP